MKRVEQGDGCERKEVTLASAVALISAALAMTRCSEMLLMERSLATCGANGRGFELASMSKTESW
jgi:hypothetical protein